MIHLKSPRELEAPRDVYLIVAEILEDGWTAVTKDRSRSAHFEHSIAITETGPEILSRL